MVSTKPNKRIQKWLFMLKILMHFSLTRISQDDSRGIKKMLFTTKPPLSFPCKVILWECFLQWTKVAIYFRAKLIITV